MEQWLLSCIFQTFLCAFDFSPRIGTLLSVHNFAINWVITTLTQKIQQVVPNICVVCALEHFAFRNNVCWIWFANVLATLLMLFSCYLHLVRKLPCHTLVKLLSAQDNGGTSVVNYML